MSKNLNKIIENDILIWFKKKKKKINRKKNFLEQEYLDSFDVMDLIFYLEKKFKIKFKNTDFQEPDFATINKLVYLIKKYSE